MRRLLVLAALLVGCASPTEPDPCPVMWYDTPTRNAVGDSTGTWQVGVALCGPGAR